MIKLRIGNPKGFPFYFVKYKKTKALDNFAF